MKINITDQQSIIYTYICVIFCLYLIAIVRSFSDIHVRLPEKLVFLSNYSQVILINSIENLLKQAMSLVTENLCPNCGSALRAVQNLDNKDFFQELDLLYDCIICGYRYSYTTESITDDSKSLYCTICDKHFNQSSSLKRHMVSHSGERPFCCEQCDKTFKTKAALKRHSIIHTGECPFECSTCKRKFNQISNLRKHLVIHNNNCPFYCDVCGKGFNQLSNLKKHLVVHREEKVLTDQEGRPAHSIVPKGSEKSVTRPVLTFVKPAES